MGALRHTAKCDRMRIKENILITSWYPINPHPHAPQPTHTHPFHEAILAFQDKFRGYDP